MKNTTKNNIFLILLIVNVVSTFLYLNLNYDYITIEIVNVIITVLFLMYMGIKNKIIIEKKDIVRIIILVIIQMMSFMYSMKWCEMTNIYIYKFFEFILYYIVFFCGSKKIKGFSIKDFDKIMKTFSIVALISSIYALVFQMGKKVFVLNSTSGFTMANIYRSFWGHRNLFSLVLICGILSNVYLYIKNHKKVDLIKILFLCFNLIFTFSRSAYGLIIIFFLSYIFINNKKSKKILIYGLIIVTILGMSTWGMYKSNQKFSNFMNTYIIRNKSKLTGREDIWKNATNYINTPTLLIGRGVGIHRVILNESDIIGGKTGFHNLYLTVLVDGGIVLLAVYLSIFYNIYKRLRKNNDIDDKMKKYFISVMIGFLVYSYFEVIDIFGFGLQNIIMTYFCIVLPNLFLVIQKKERRIKVEKHAYLIIAHNQPEILIKLLGQIDDKRNDIYIHIDKKSNFFDLEELKKSVKESKIYIYSNYDIRWGDRSQVECEMFLLKQSHKGKYLYYHIISGVDMILKKQDYIHKFFYENKGKEFVHFDSKICTDKSKERVLYKHIFTKKYKVSKSKFVNKFYLVIDTIYVKLQKMLNIKKDIEFKEIQKGCNWCSITNDLVELILENENSIMNLIEKSKCADEIFIQTVLINSKYKDNIYNPLFNNDYKSCMRLIIWDNPKTPHTFTIDDYELIKNTDCIFARKFDSKKDYEIVKKIYNETGVI